MAVLNSNKKRILFPRWRDARIETNSLILLKEKQVIKNGDTLSDILINHKKEFAENKTFSNALEVVNSAFSLSKEDKAIEEANFILSLKKKLPNTLNKILHQITKETLNETEDKEIIVIDPLLSNIFIEAGKNISFIRKRLKVYPYNPLLWLELSRLHSILGQIKKAETASQIALRLSENSNRFITRSVSRFFIHIKDYERAQHIVRSSPPFKVDPWLIAADISYSQLMNRIPSSIKIGKELVESKTLSKNNITELASAIGTHEFLNRSAYEAVKFFSLSLEEPNDNSFAQAEFFNIIEDGQHYFNELPNNFEAQSIRLNKEKKFNEALSFSFQWLKDQPFSRRAAYFNSYLLCGTLENFEKAIEFGKFSLHSNPDSFLLNNNTAYSYAMVNDIKNAKIFLRRMKKISCTNLHEKIVLLATEGLIKYREGKIEEGRRLFKESMQEAENQKNIIFKTLALINFTKEEYLSKSIDEEEAFKIISSIDNEVSNSEEVQDEIRSIKKVICRNYPH